MLVVEPLPSEVFLPVCSWNLIIQGVTKGFDACSISVDQMPFSQMTSAKPAKFPDNNVLSALVLHLYHTHSALCCLGTFQV